MNRIQITKNFYLDEFVHPEVYSRFQGRSRLFIRQELFEIAQAVRDQFGAIYINTWSHGGGLKESGLRLPDTTTGAKFSMHKYGCAIDIHPLEAKPSAVREFVKAHYEDIFKPLGLKRMEANTPTWVHLDVGNTGSDELLIFNP